MPPEAGKPPLKSLSTASLFPSTPNTPDDAIYKVRNFVGESLPVIDAETGRLQVHYRERAFPGHYRPETGAKT